MTATEELRRLLDERGVEWIHGRLSSESTAWLDGNVAVVADEYGDGLLLVERKMTPEQAVEATLGRGTCKNVGYYIDSTRFECSACGYNGWTRYAAYGEDRVPRYCPNCGRKVVEA